MSRRTPKPSKKVETTRHQDMRVNIPTEELRDFVANDEKAPRKMIYPRDTTLDPQLVWKGKDEQDERGLEVPIVPLYIQEKIHPQAIVEEVRQYAKAEADGPQQMSLFSDFNGIEFDKLVEFYQHEQHWSNRMILGDSLQVMASLAEKEGLQGKVQMIYFDPPYGIKFGSNWQVSTRKRDVKDGKVDDVVRQPEQVKAFRDTWELGIHSYLSYIRDRLTIARELLTDSGSIFVQISDENVHVVRSTLDEVFGSENFISFITFSTTTGQTSDFLSNPSDYILWYAKNKSSAKYRQLFNEKSVFSEGASGYKYIEMENGERKTLSIDETQKLAANSKIFMLGDLTSQRQGRPSGIGTAMYFPVQVINRLFYPSGNRGWSTTEVGVDRLLKASRVHVSQTVLQYVRYLNDFPAIPINSLWNDTASGFMRDKVYVVQTNTKVIQRCMLMTTDPGDLVLDPTMGSGSTAYVAEQWGRRWITIDTSRVALALARTRLMSARFPYYVLADSPDGLLEEARRTGGLPIERDTNNDIRHGFVYDRVPHITLKSIANNEEIDEIWHRWQETLEPLRHELNAHLNQSWQEWEIPREPAADWHADTVDLLAQYWDARRSRQAEIDASIARRADTEILYDKPAEDRNKVRVTGAFTVESLSPHRFVAADDSVSIRSQDRPPFEQVILDNLRAAGVQNTKKDERLKFDALDSYAGTYVQGEGRYTDSAGVSRRVAISIGPEYGTVSADDVKEAAKEAVKGVGFDLLIVCGFAFDPHVTEEGKRYGNLQVLIVRMNADLMIGDALLKKTGSGNLFTVFGEPDVELRSVGDQLQVILSGLDIYDPTTGQTRTSSVDDIACWFIDTNYNGESFFVRHAYFLGAGDPYKQLRSTLKAEIDESAWEALYTNESLPFDRPSTRKIAIKVINHYGDEVLKVWDVG